MFRHLYKKTPWSVFLLAELHDFLVIVYT